jgi:hypothetical protein
VDLAFASPVMEDACSYAPGTVMPRRAQNWPVLLVTTALMAGCVAPSGPDQASVDANTPTKSINSNTPALITFVNQSQQTVDIYWIDFGGNRQLYKTLEIGGSLTQQTYLTHPWLVTDASGQPWSVYLPQAQPRTIYLQAPATVAR